MRLADGGLTAADSATHLESCESRYRLALDALITDVLTAVPMSARERIAARALELAQADADLKIARDMDYQLRFSQDPLLDGPR